MKSTATSINKRGTFWICGRCSGRQTLGPGYLEKRWDWRVLASKAAVVIERPIGQMPIRAPKAIYSQDSTRKGKTKGWRDTAANWDDYIFKALLSCSDITLYLNVLPLCNQKKPTERNVHFKALNLKLPNPPKSTLDFLPPWKQQSIQPTDWPPMNFR